MNASKDGEKEEEGNRMVVDAPRPDLQNVGYQRFFSIRLRKEKRVPLLIYRDIHTHTNKHAHTNVQAYTNIFTHICTYI